MISIMMAPLSEDPSGAFDYSLLTPIHNGAYDTIFGLLLTAGWFLALAGAVVVMLIRRRSATKENWTLVKRLLGLSATLLIVPPLVSLGMNVAGLDGDQVPNMVGFVQGAKTTNKSGEFVAWAKQRYGITLNERQATDLCKLVNKGFMQPSHETNPVIFNGSLMHGIFASNQIILANEHGTEMPLIVNNKP